MGAQGDTIKEVQQNLNGNTNKLRDEVIHAISCR